jgi:hypothetical protein
MPIFGPFDAVFDAVSPARGRLTGTGFAIANRCAAAVHALIRKI